MSAELLNKMAIEDHDGIPENDHSSDHSVTSGSGDSESQKNPSRSKESKQILYLRITVATVLLLAASLTAFAIFKITRSGEKDEFETQFHDHANKVIDAFEANIHHTIGAMDNLAVSITSYAQTTSATWPLVAPPQFEISAASSRSLAGADVVTFLPMVTNTSRHDWEEFAVLNLDWIEAGLEREEISGSGSTHADHRSRRRRVLLLSDEELVLEDDEDEDHHEEEHAHVPANITASGTSDAIYFIEDLHHVAIVEVSDGPFFPVWQTTPVHQDIVNYNLLSHATLGPDLKNAWDTKAIVFGRIADISDIHDPFNFLFHEFDVIEEGEENDHDGHADRRLAEEDHEEEEEDHEDEDEDHEGEEGEHGGHLGDPLSMVFFPVFDGFEEPRELVGFVSAVIYWSDFFRNILPPSAQPITVIMENNCGDSFTLDVHGEAAAVLGEGDLHENCYNDLEISFHFQSIVDSADDGSLTYSGVGLDANYCPYHLRIYPSTEMEDYYLTSQPAYYAGIVCLTFLFTAVIFLIYDYLVEKRQKIVSQEAKETSAVVNSLFPAVVRERMFQDAGKGSAGDAFKLGAAQNANKGSAPIADLFPNTTVMFGDIAGFTAWSSIREPAQVFTLLETVYGVFDSIARKRKVFKVETIGDCYVAVTGLPEPQANHAAIMAKFAFECTSKMNEKTRELEQTLGPDTGNLKLRVGLHSGAVTAGVLRGEKSRFQLFGDTVNTASRMESTGMSCRIQCSEATANLLIAAGKSMWLSKREGFVQAKGKGQMTTYWVNPGATSTANGGTSTNGTSTNGDPHEVLLDEIPSHSKTELMSIEKPVTKELGEEEAGLCRLVDWNVDLLQKLLLKIVARRGKANKVVAFRQIHSTNPRDEVTEVVNMAPFDPAAAKMDLNCTEIDPIVCGQLKDYVKTIASTYMNNPFHNFYHASHVTMSASKLINRINSADQHGGFSGQVGSNNGFDSNLHAATYGIASDPLTQFAVVFSAMIHDVNHPGVPNGQLIKEATDMAAVYDNKSIAEQNSIDIAWDLLMEPSYKELQNCIFADEAEYNRFRNLVINSVIATDIFDKELKDLRNTRWTKVFHPEDFNGEEKDENFSLINAKATIVIEHIIQASDVSHTMQHWHVYQKWNEKLFAEMYAAYKSGRANQDPSEGWYKGELWFYDNYIIPLARKLEECGVFGVSSDEYLNYALENRDEWEAKGESLVQTWLSKYS